MLNFSSAFFFSGFNFSVFRRLFPCLCIVPNLILLQGLIFGEVLATEFHISLLLYAMALCALKKRKRRKLKRGAANFAMESSNMHSRNFNRKCNCKKNSIAGHGRHQTP
ncbi:hypothetical protein AABB24_003541 [Solanum stoloniferum]|uniref:Uncharacterized protein n=1 Tax=Solanum stoloniferum TaxID=62892 RepID=A0ABD2V8X7_9SOLN